MRGSGVHVVAADDAHIMTVDARAEIVAALEGPAAVAKQLWVLFALAFRLRRALLHPLPAFGKAVGSERWVGLDRVVEIHARLEQFVFDGGVGLRLAGQ